MSVPRTRLDRIPAWARWGTLVAACFVLGVIQFAGVWDKFFYKDDTQWIADAREIAHSPAALFQHNPDNRECVVRPFQRIGMAAIYRAAGANPAPYAFASVALHAIAAAFVFAFVRAVLRVEPAGGCTRTTAIALAAALLFLLTRVHMAAVVWIAAQSTILAAIAVLALSWCVLRRGTSTLRDFATVAAGFVIALYCKSTAAGFALVYPILAWRRHGGASAGRIALQTAVLLAIAVAHAVFTKQILGDVDVSAALSPDGGQGYRLGGNVLHNLAAAIVSSVMLPLEYHALLGPGRGPAIGALVLLGMTLATLRWVKDRNAILLGIAFVVAFALPTSLFDYDQFADANITVSRYYYAGFAGVALLCGVWLAAVFRGRGRTFHAALVPALVVAAAGWVGWQKLAISAQIRWFRAYSEPRRYLVNTTLAWAEEYAGPGSVFYAINWKEDDAQIRGLGRLYFQERGFALQGEQALRDFDVERPDDVQHFAVRYEDAANRFQIFAIDGLLAKATALAPQPPRQPAADTKPVPR